GHRRLLVLEPPGDTRLFSAARNAAGRYAPYASIEVSSVESISSMLNGPTALLCDSESLSSVWDSIGPRVAPTGELSVAAGGITASPKGSGISLAPAELASAATKLLRAGHMHRPAVVWLTGTYIDQ